MINIENSYLLFTKVYKKCLLSQGTSWNQEIKLNIMSIYLTISMKIHYLIFCDNYKFIPELSTWYVLIIRKKS
jgi:hypothetical protein